MAICLSSLGTLNVKTFTAGRLTQAAAEHGYLPLMMKTVASVDDKDDTEDAVLEDDTPSAIGLLGRPVKIGDGSIPT